MDNPMFRDLRSDEIEVRVAQATQKGVSLLLYKDARVDQNILDETVGAYNWQRHHTRENANCVVAIWDSEKQQWVSKEDTGTESNTEKEKGLASDSFKRACFNWGIGRELYTAPFIWINAQDCERLQQNDKTNRWQCVDSFEVEKIDIQNKRITGLAIRNAKTRKVCFSWTSGKSEPKNEEPKTTSTKKPDYVCSDCGCEIKPYQNAEGKWIGAKRHFDASVQQFGRGLCLNCIGKLREGAE